MVKRREEQAPNNPRECAWAISFPGMNSYFRCGGTGIAHGDESEDYDHVYVDDRQTHEIGWDEGCDFALLLSWLSI